ncbi:DUF427 domain-containing protein [Halomonas sp. NyZ770]|uniref:DUF427 domain-containing protein n=1 Tax=Halomonas sp. NyZ770 TaxID=2883106 RepID=UPI001D0B2BE7|nr:DUF427 domain-containing protein [Halomonas sp. NyZ770]UDM08317.1 DUF427 domain-containing protein [Halomonas sp. NyZ770]
MQNARITLHPSKQRMQVRVDDILLADSTNTLGLCEHGYPPCHYFPRDDVRMGLLTVSETTTYCPFKGHAVYFSLGERRDIAWSYEEPIEGMEAITGRVAFYGVVNK